MDRDLSENRFDHFPSQISQLANLESLYYFIFAHFLLNRNLECYPYNSGVTEGIPKSFENLSKLKSLYVFILFANDSLFNI